MASELDVLLDKVDDPALRADLKRQVELLRSKRRFGLVFEEHLPERVQLPEHTVRRGTRVVLRDDADVEPREVVKVDKDKATVRSADGETEVLPVTELVVVADFGEPIYPGLRRLGSLKAGGDKPGHVVIKGENHHVLEALQFTHAGKVDCIYIDPPYNTGARDWRYGNDYVDKDDAYRHSKWLSMMERRLGLAIALLKPDGVLVVTIDEHEVSRLGVLLSQLFPNALIQMVSIVINPSGVSSDGLSRVDEYAYFCFFGGSQPTPLEVDLLDDRPAGDAKAGKRNVRWEWLLRGGGSWYRESRPNLCYPVLLSADGTRIVGTGEPWTDKDEAKRPLEIEGLPVAWPVRGDGRLGIWRLDRRRLLELAEKGYAFVSDHSPERGTWTLRYLLSGTIAAIESAELEVVGYGERGEVLVAGQKASYAIPKTVWKSSRHIAGGAGGTQMLSTLLGERNLFTYPKSVYAVEDTIMAAVGDRPDAVILDFFAGSGTTTHAAARLNRQDGGRRQSIIVTNNEVADAEVRRLRAAGHRPGEREWETRGIFENVTKPRIEAAFTGCRPDGTTIPATAKYVDGTLIADGLDENVEFFELTYLDPEDVEISAAFEGVAPLLWLRAGGRGEMIEHDAPYYAVMDTYGVLFDPDRWRKFVSALHDDVKTVFIVTDSPSIFAAIASELPAGVEAVRLYENYLSTFTLDTRRTMPIQADGR
jgi:adenine-specific DNA-methyltransferase